MLKASLAECFPAKRFFPSVIEPVHMKGVRLSLNLPGEECGWKIVPDRSPCEVIIMLQRNVLRFVSIAVCYNVIIFV